jgi:hypothetical protein
MSRVSAYEILGNKIKVKYENLEWNKHNSEAMNYDLFENLDQVKSACGAFGNDLESTSCWLDVYNWSLMNKTKLTEDIYQFISHRAYIVRSSIEKEIESFSFNTEFFVESWNAFVERGMLDCIILILEVFGL